MSAGAWTFLLFPATLSVVFAGIVIHYYRAKRRDRAERPKYRMLEDDREPQERQPGRR